MFLKNENIKMKYQANLNLISDSFSGKYNLMYNNESGWSKK